MNKKDSLLETIVEYYSAIPVTLILFGVIFQIIAAMTNAQGLFRDIANYTIVIGIFSAAPLVIVVVILLLGPFIRALFSKDFLRGILLNILLFGSICGTIIGIVYLLIYLTE